MSAIASAVKYSSLATNSCLLTEWIGPLIIVAARLLNKPVLTLSISIEYLLIARDSVRPFLIWPGKQFIILMECFVVDSLTIDFTPYSCLEPFPDALADSRLINQDLGPEPLNAFTLRDGFLPGPINEPEPFVCFLLKCVAVAIITLKPRITPTWRKPKDAFNLHRHHTPACGP